MFERLPPLEMSVFVICYLIRGLAEFGITLLGDGFCVGLFFTGCSDVLPSVSCLMVLGCLRILNVF